MNRVLKLISQNIIMRIALLFLILSLFVFSYAVVELDSLTTRVQEKRATLNNRQNIQLNFEEVLESYNRQYTELNNKLVKFRPDLDQIVVLLNTLEAESKAIGLSIEIESLSQEEKDYIRYRVSFTANNEQLFSFLEVLNKLPSFIQIEDVFIASVQDFEMRELANYGIVFDIFIK